MSLKQLCAWRCETFRLYGHSSAAPGIIREKHPVWEPLRCSFSFGGKHCSASRSWQNSFMLVKMPTKRSEVESPRWRSIVNCAKIGTKGLRSPALLLKKDLLLWRGLSVEINIDGFKVGSLLSVAWRVCKALILFHTPAVLSNRSASSKSAIVCPMLQRVAHCVRKNTLAKQNAHSILANVKVRNPRTCENSMGRVSSCIVLILCVGMCSERDDICSGPVMLHSHQLCGFFQQGSFW